MNPPPAWCTASVHDVARRVARLLDHPRRRTAVLRRAVWPYRLIGGLINLAPWLGDWAMAGMIRRMEQGRRTGSDS